jgi:stage V sporulation protein B
VVTEAEKPSPRSEDIAARAGRGGVAVLGAKVYFILAGFVQQPLLKALIGLDGYGALSRVLVVANVVNNVVVTSSTQGVSRVVASAGDRDPEALRGALRVHVPLAVVAGTVFALAAPLVARFQRAPHIEAPLLAAAVVVLLYGLYAPLVGALNGRGQFGRQAMLDTTFATLRTVALLGGGWLLVRSGGAGELGAMVGFACAAALIVPVALRWSGTGRTANPVVVRAGPYLAGLVPLSLAQLFTNALMQIDLALLGRFLSAAATDTGLVEEAARKAADEWVGVYRACQLFAFLPYQLLLSITQVLFPMLAKARAEGDTEAVRTYTARGVRLAAIVGGGLVATVAASPAALLRFAYGAEGAERGADTLRVLALGQSAFALMGISSAVLASLGRERRAALVTLVALVASTASCWLVVPGAPFGAPQLQASALAVSGALALGLALAAFEVRRAAGAFLPPLTGLRVAAAVALTTFAGRFVPPVGRLAAPLVAMGAAVVYALLLAASREVKGADLAAFGTLLRRRR